MNYPSSNCGCDTSEPTTGATGTAGCTGLDVPCISVQDGRVVSLTNRTLSIPTDEVCPSDLCQEAATSNQAILWNGSIWAPTTVLPSVLGQQSATANDLIAWNGTIWAPASLASLGGGKTAEFCFYDSVGFSGNITLASNGSPAPDPTDYSFYRCAFNPTDFAVYCWAVNGENAGAVFGFQLQWSTDLSTWTSATGVLDLDNTFAEPVQLVGTLSIPGNPTVVYLRLIYVNLTGNDRVISIRNLQISAWR